MVVRCRVSKFLLIHCFLFLFHFFSAILAIPLLGKKKNNKKKISCGGLEHAEEGDENFIQACAIGHQDDVLRRPCCCVAQVFNEELI